MPTETFSAWRSHPFQEEALARLFALKDRAPESRCWCWWTDQGGSIRWCARSRVWPGGLWKNFWPGPLSLIFPEPVPSGPAAHRGHRDHRGAPTPATGYLPLDRCPGAPHHRHQRQSLVASHLSQRADEVPWEFGEHSGPDPGGGSLVRGIAVYHCGRNQLLIASGRAGRFQRPSWPEIMPELDEFRKGALCE